MEYGPALAEVTPTPPNWVTTAAPIPAGWEVGCARFTAGTVVRLLKNTGGCNWIWACATGASSSAPMAARKSGKRGFITVGKKEC